MTACIGCSYCCKSSVCEAGQRAYFIPAKAKCPGLRWDRDKNRYFCSLCEIKGEIGFNYRKEISIGKGCLFPHNQQRDNIEAPIKDIKIEPKLPKELQVFLHHLGKNFVNPDAIWLAANSTERDLNIKGFQKACLLAFSQQVSRQAEEMMGKVEVEA